MFIEASGPTRQEGAAVTRDQLARRDVLFRRSDAALERWPDRQAAEFVREMTAVAEGLVALTGEIGRDRTDTVERARTWRYLGNAYFDLGATDKTQLPAAAAAFRKSEALLGRADEPVEKLKLNYSFGQTLMCQSSVVDPGLIPEARARFVTALGLAQTHMPSAVSHIQRSLQDADRVLALLGQASQLGRRIDDLQRTLSAPPPQMPPERVPPAAAGDDIQSLFGVLQGVFEKEKRAMEPTRRQGLEDVMSRLGTLVAGESREQSLEDMMSTRGSLDGLMRELHPQVRKPTLKGPRPPAGSRSERILAALQELKMFVAGRGMQQGTPRFLRDAAMDLFARIASLTTWIGEAGEDAQRLRALEMDQARGLANEVRLFSRRSQMMLARPVWGRYGVTIEANRLFFSGPAGVRASLAAAAGSLGVELNDTVSAGATFAEHRWQSLRAANVAVFDLSDGDPQVYYELGIALAAGAHLLLVAREDTSVPFDVAQNIRYYPAGGELRAFLAGELDDALYGLSVRGGERTSLAATVAFAERLSASDSGNALLRVAFDAVRNASADPVQMLDALNTFNGFLGERRHEILFTRWPGEYPDPQEPRGFAVMPFRDEANEAYAAVAAAAEAGNVTPVRGDIAEGQEIIESIWEEICRATHVTVDLSDFNLNVCLELGIAHTLGRPTRLIGRSGTERTLQQKLPGVAKWRCFTYQAGGRPSAELRGELARFFGRTG